MPIRDGQLCILGSHVYLGHMVGYLGHMYTCVTCTLGSHVYLRHMYTWVTCILGSHGGILGSHGGILGSHGGILGIFQLKKLLPREERYSTIDKECLTI